MEEILDQAFDENEKDERWINLGIALIRLVIALRFSYILIELIQASPPSSISKTQAILIIVLPGLFILMIIHSLYRILSEFIRRFIIPKENRVIALFMIIVYLTLGGLFYYATFDMIRSYYENQHFSSLSIKDIEPFLITVGLSTIIFREVIYFKRATRLKQLKITKP